MAPLKSESIPVNEATTVIRPNDGSLRKGLTELIRHRAIFRNLMRRDWQRQYVELKFGWLWVFARPLLMTTIFVLLKRGSSANVLIHIPYPVYLYAGLVVWFVWVEAVGSVATSGKLNGVLMSKIYFPRLYSPLAQASSSGLRTLIGLIPLAGFMAYFRIMPGWELVFAPILLVQSVFLAFSVGTIFGILSIDRNDWNNARSLVLYVGIFLAPIVYPVQMIPEAYRTYYMLNPMVGVIDGFRGAIVGNYAFPYEAWGISLCVTVLLTTIAVVMFKRTEAHMLDEL